MQVVAKEAKQYGRGVSKPVLHEVLFDCGHSRRFESKPAIGDVLFCISCDDGATVVPWPVP